MLMLQLDLIRGLFEIVTLLARQLYDNCILPNEPMAQGPEGGLKTYLWILGFSTCLPAMPLYFIKNRFSKDERCEFLKLSGIVTGRIS